MKIVSHVAFLLIAGCVAQSIASPPFPEPDEPFDQFVERWNAWVDSIPEDQRAGDSLVKAIDEIESDDFPNERLWEERGYHKGDVLGYAYPWNEYWQDAPRIFDLYEPQLNHVYEITRRPHLAIKIAAVPTHENAEFLPENLISDYQVEYMGALRTAATFLAGHASYLVFNGQSDQAFSRLIAVADLVDRTTELPAILSWMSANGIRSRFQSSIIEMLEYDPDIFEDHHLAEFQSRIVEDLESNLSSQFIFEQWLTQKTWRIMFEYPEFLRTDRKAKKLFNQASTMSYFLLRESTCPFPNLPNPDTEISIGPLKDQIELHQQLVAAIVEDFQEDPATLMSLRFKEIIHEQLSGDGVDWYLPMFERVVLWRFQFGMKKQDDYEARNNLVILGIHRHRLQTGNWPKSLDEINPELLPYSTTDLYSGELLGYRLSRAGPHVWAFGADRDDDRGWPVKTVEGEWGQPERTWFSLDEWNALSDEDQAKYDGDWKIWQPSIP